MKGSHVIYITTRKLRYEITVRRNITIILGDSGTGKTTLVQAVKDYETEGKQSGIHLQCDKNCCVLESRHWDKEIKSIKDSIVFIDEGAAFIASYEFSRAIQDTDNYYVIVTRHKLSNLPYSINEIYELSNEGSDENHKVYNKQNQVYKSNNIASTIKIEHIITEDSKTGFEFFELVAKNHNITCESARGKSNVVSFIKSNETRVVILIVDGAAYGSEMRDTMELIKKYHNYILYTPESFEWILLNSEILQYNNLRRILDNPENYIESSKYISWERFFTDLLVTISKDSIVGQYSKSNKLNEYFTNKVNQEKIISKTSIKDMIPSNNIG